jgi:hypothetical protein
MRTASCGLLTYAKRRFDYFRDRTYRWPSLLSIPASIFYSFASIIATLWIETRLARTLKLLPAVAVETPHATALWKSLATRLGINPQKIHCIPHPIQTDIFKFDPAIPKRIRLSPWGGGTLTKRTCLFFSKPSELFSIKTPPGPHSSSALDFPLNLPTPESRFFPLFRLLISPATCRGPGSSSPHLGMKVLAWRQ